MIFHNERLQNQRTFLLSDGFSFKSFNLFLDVFFDLLSLWMNATCFAWIAPTLFRFASKWWFHVFSLRFKTLEINGEIDGVEICFDCGDGIYFVNAVKLQDKFLVFDQLVLLSIYNRLFINLWHLKVLFYLTFVILFNVEMFIWTIVTVYSTLVK